MNEPYLHVPNRTSKEKDAHFQSLLLHIARNPEEKGPMIKSHLSLEVPGKEAPSLFSQWGT
jgi:hypothetical protein